MTTDFFAAEFARRLQAEGIRSKHALGQHFLIDPQVLDAVVEGSGIQAGDAVIEIGPGLGVLTDRLLKEGAHVFAFEFDPSMLSILKRDFAQAIQEGRLRLIEGDALVTLPHFLSERDQPYKVAANIPYQITTPLFQIFFEHPEWEAPVQSAFLVQKEVAERLVARAGDSDRSYLSVALQRVMDMRLDRVVLPASFFPPPQVDSAVLVCVPRTKKPAVDDERKFLKFVKMSFQQRRKQLKNVLAGVRGLSQDQVVLQLQAVGLPPMARAQELTEEQWIALYAARI